MKTTEQKLQVLAKIAEAFRQEEITWAVGASLLLYLKGIADEFHDIDILVMEQDTEKVRRALQKLGHLNPPNPDRQYRTRCFLEFVIDGVDVDVMAGFVIVCGREEYDCSLQKEQIVEYTPVDGRMIPLQSAELWKKYYALMGRSAKVSMIECALHEKKR